MSLKVKKSFALGFLIILVFATVFGVLWAANSWLNVGQGYATLIVDAQSRTVSEPIIGASAGLYINGFSRMIGLQYPVSVYIATDTFQEDLSCFSADQLEMTIQVLISWRLDPSRVKQLYMSYPFLNYKEKAIQSIMEKTIRFVTKNYTALETIAFREGVANTIQTAVSEALSKEPSLSQALMEFRLDLKNIGYPKTYTDAIEKKLAAEQAKIQAQFEYERALTLAKAEADSKVIVANGTRDAVRTIISITGETNSTRITELYLTLEALKNVAPNTQSFVVIFGSGGIPLVYPLPTNSTLP
jgi:regulator of protease activity HflC (stomatin/prohibitin superfamily)